MLQQRLFAYQEIECLPLHCKVYLWLDKSSVQRLKRELHNTQLHRISLYGKVVVNVTVGRLECVELRTAVLDYMNVVDGREEDVELEYLSVSGQHRLTSRMK